MRPRLLDRPSYTDRAVIRNRILRGASNVDAQRDAWRDRFYFTPTVGRRLRAVSNRAVGHTLGGTREAQ
jgi:hypothetical protein